MGWGGCEGLIGSVWFTHLIIVSCIDGSVCVMAWLLASGFTMGIVYDVANEIMNALSALEKIPRRSSREYLPVRGKCSYD